MKLRATVYPNNEVRVALYPEKLPQNYFKSGSDLGESPENHPGTDESDITLITLDSSPIERDRALDIKSKDDTTKRHRRWALSRNGRNQILRAGACFDKSPQTERLLLTGTLPGSTIAAFRVLAENSTIVTKRLTNWITRHEPKCNWMYVWEFQGRGALHVHIVVECQETASTYFKAHFKDEWIKLLRDVSSESKTDLFAKTANYSHDPQKTQTDVRVCDREPSRYISKYITKEATNSKGFSRFPPKTWYQISRNLLRRLRERTVTYEVEGLSFRQARKCEEDAISYLSNHAIAGHRRFDGACYAWSGYCYVENFKPSELSPMLEKRNQCLMSTQQVANLARSTMKNYAASSCFVRSATSSSTFQRMESGLITETELLLYIEAVIKTLSQRLSTESSPWAAAHFLKTADAWYRSKFGYSKLSPNSLVEVNKINECDLTDKASRTTLDKQQFRLNIV